MQVRPSRIRSCLRAGSVGRAAVSSIVATACDYGMFRCALVVCAWPALATLWGCVVGGVVNFTINRYWAFQHRGHVGRAMARYVTTSGTSALANVGLVALATSALEVPENPAWLGARVLVFLGLTYPLFRRWVFGEPDRRTGSSLSPPAEKAGAE